MRDPRRSRHQLIKEGRALRDHLLAQEDDWKLAVTLQSNATTNTRMMQRNLQSWHKRITRKIGGRDWNKNTDRMPTGYAFLEGHPDITEGHATLHWHIILSWGPAAKPKWLTPFGHDRKPRCHTVFETAWRRAYWHGTCKTELLTPADAIRWSTYITKDLMGRHVRTLKEMEEVHDNYIILPIEMPKAEHT